MQLMPNRYANLTGTNRISDEYELITEGFDGVQADVDALQGEAAGIDAAVQAAQSAADAAQSTADQAQQTADDATQAAVDLNERVDNIVAQSGDDITEIVDARQPAAGPAYPTLKGRLDAGDNRITVSASPPSGTPLANSIWYEDLGESPDLGGGGLIIANASLDGTKDIWFAAET